jgi:hypothetical protein
MRAIRLITLLTICSFSLPAFAQQPGATPVAPAPAADPLAEGARVVGTISAGGEGSGDVVVFARDALTPTKTTYLGVSTSSAPPALQKQLQLKAGVGLVVDGCETGSPAEKAGVKEFDVLHKLDDQLLINTEQLGVLVRSMESGKACNLTVIREGASQVLPVTLGQRDVPPMRFAFRNVDSGFGEAVFVDLAGQPSRVVTGGQLFTPNPVSAIRLHTPDGKQELTAARITIENDKHKMTVSSPEGGKHLRVEDKKGKVLFDGPISTAEELERVPADLRQAYTEVLKDYSVDTKPLEPPAPTAPTAPGAPDKR